MSAKPFKPQMTRPAIIAVTMLSVAACSASDHENTGKPGTSASPTSSAPNPPPRPPVGLDHVEGLVRSVSDSTIQLTQRDRSAATVDFTSATVVTELTSAQLTDVTPGSCVEVETGAASAPPGGAITALSVTISPAEGGTCAPPKEPCAGSASAPSSIPSPGEHTDGPDVCGSVSSVTDNTIAVAGTDPTGKTTHTNVIVNDTTIYNQHAITSIQAVEKDKCIAAQGTKTGGALQAAAIDIEPCPPMGHPHHHFHLPHLHHH
jgi:hypothetical protein